MFGNALDVAHRLNTLGKPMKIHISVDTKLLLDSIGGFHTKYRGLHETKVTYEFTNFRTIKMLLIKEIQISIYITFYFS